MKFTPLLPALAAIVLPACESMNAPMSGGGFDPLNPAGGVTRQDPAGAGAMFTPGKFMQAAIDNTAFFKQRPKGSANADRLLPQGTPMKIVSSDPSYVKVELDTGEVGFVPSVMVADTSAITAPVIGNPNEVQVYPPVPGNGLPFDATGVPVPPVEGGVPPIIDPNAPPPALGTPPVEIEPSAPRTPAPLPPSNIPGQ